MPSSGFVYLVGAGPGDPSLLTLRAYELLHSAEIVAHDELVTDAILALAPPEAERLKVGRRGGHGKTNYRLHPAILDRARMGHTVVRLKCGDPFVFGRGGEEAEELTESGIPFEVVPGVSSALGAAAYAGIPLTHRERSSSVTFVTGHDADDERQSLSETRVVFMPTRRLARHLARLITNGWKPSTPAACIYSATTPHQRVVVGTLADLAERTRGLEPNAPALVIAGDVVAVRDKIAWLERQPLRGRRVLVARAREGRSEIAAELRMLGAQVFEAPNVEISSRSDESALTQALARLTDYEAVVFGCAAGVEVALRHRELAGVPIIAVGREAQRALDRRGIESFLRIDGACREALEKCAGDLRDRRLLVIASEDGRPSLEDELLHFGARVDVVAAYRRIADIGLPAVDLVVLPSSSAARALLGHTFGNALVQLPMLAMGPRTAVEARKYGATRVTEPETDSKAALVASALSILGAL